MGSRQRQVASLFGVLKWEVFTRTLFGFVNSYELLDAPLVNVTEKLHFHNSLLKTFFALAVKGSSNAWRLLTQRHFLSKLLHKLSSKSSKLHSHFYAASLLYISEPGLFGYCLSRFYTWYYYTTYGISFSRFGVDKVQPWRENSVSLTNWRVSTCDETLQNHLSMQVIQETVTPYR